MIVFSSFVSEPKNTPEGFTIFADGHFYQNEIDIKDYRSAKTACKNLNSDATLAIVTKKTIQAFRLEEYPLKLKGWVMIQGTGWGWMRGIIATNLSPQDYIKTMLDKLDSLDDNPENAIFFNGDKLTAASQADKMHYICQIRKLVGEK